jgi:hypothetical protein
VHVHDARAARLAAAHVQRAVVERPRDVLVEAGHDVARPRRARRAPLLVHALRHRRRVERELVDGAFEEVPGERRFGEHDQLRYVRRARELREHVAHRRQVRHEVALARLELHQRGVHALISQRRATA